MRTRLASWLRRLTQWIDPPQSLDAVVLTVPIDALYHRARVLVDVAQQAHSSDHREAKRHQVLAQLGKDFPNVSPRGISLAIEAAVSRMGVEQGSERG